MTRDQHHTLFGSLVVLCLCIIAIGTAMAVYLHVPWSSLPQWGWLIIAGVTALLVVLPVGLATDPDKH